MKKEDWIKERINMLKGRGVVPAPIKYSELFLKIMEFGGLDKEDIARYFEYIPLEIKNLLK